MAQNISVKKVPDEIVLGLKARAQLHHRSLQGEVLSILEAVVLPKRKLSIDEVDAEVKRLGIKTTSNSTQIIREDRDHGH